MAAKKLIKKPAISKGQPKKKASSTKKAAKKTAKKATKRAKSFKQVKTSFTYDRKTGRWRKNGRWAKAPRRSQLRIDSLGRPLDATGRLVPMAAIAAGRKVVPTGEKRKPRRPKPPSRKRVLPKRKKWGAPIYVPLPPYGRGAQAYVEYLPPNAAVTDKSLFSSTFDNRDAPVMAGDVLFNVVGAKTYKMPIGADDVVMYRYGVHFVATSETNVETKDLFAEVKYLARDFPQFSYQFGADSVHVFLGEKDTPVSRRTARANLENNSAQLAAIYERLNELWDGDIGWFVEIENDEIEGY